METKRCRTIVCTIKVEPLFQNELRRYAFQIKFKGRWKYVGNTGILQNIPDFTKSLESLPDIKKKKMYWKHGWKFELMKQFGCTSSFLF